MVTKCIKMVKDFYSCLSRVERFEFFILPLFLCAVIIIFFIKYVAIELQATFIESFINSLQSIAAVMTAFSIAGITIILTSSSSNIAEAKKFQSNRFDNRKIELSYYQLVLIRCNYNTVLQFGLLCFAIFGQLLTSGIPHILVFVLVLVLLLHSLFVQLFVITTMYHLMWKSE